MTTDKFITILAWTSFIVAFFPMLVNGAVLLLWSLSERKGKLTIGTGAFVWITLFVWPIVYYFAR